MRKLPLVTHVLATLARGGAERLVIELAARLPARGFRTSVLVLFEHGDLWRELRDRNIRWSLVGGSFQMNRLDLFRRLTRRLYADPERRADIVHTHLFGPDVWTMAARTIHNAFHFAHGGCGVEPKFVSTAHNVDRDDSSLERAARRWAVRRMDRVIAVSEDVRRYATEDLGARKDRVTHIDGIVFPSNMPRGARPFRDVPQILMVGRLEPQKGYETALDALAHVPPPWELRIIGVGSLERDLKERCERLGIASRVRFVGEVDNVPVHLKETDLFLFPSRWEGMGMSVLEAMAAGVPVLSSDIPPLRDAIPNELRIPIDAVDAWRDAIRSVLRDPGRYVAMAQRNAEPIARRFNVDRVTDLYAGEYRKLL
ncbi:MAG TPA: glycosyltransferase family 4 protein [Candidatus Methylomirabilis sp.]|nr:glycosyltransferase family 4 protein [Candidatus Methylomirabilis sp.]